MWWSVITLTTVGYGDIFPLTPLGKLLGGLTALCGVLVFAFPSGVIASGYVEELQKRRRNVKCNDNNPAKEENHEFFCIYCGRKNILTDESMVDADKES